MIRIFLLAVPLVQLAAAAVGWLGAPAGAHAQAPVTIGSPTTSLREIKIPPNSMLRNQRVLLNGTPCDVLAFSPDGRHLAASSQLSPVIKIWDVAASTVIAEIPTGGLVHKGHHHRVAYSPDGRYFLYSGATLRGARDNASLLILSAKTYSLEAATEGPPVPPSGVYRGPPVATRRLVQAFAISPDSQTVVATYGGRPMDYESPILYALGTGKKLKAVAGADDSEAIAFSPDNRHFADGIYIPDRKHGGPGHGNIRIWDSKTMEVVRTIEGAHRGEIGSLVFTPNGRYLISGTAKTSAVRYVRPGVTTEVVIDESLREPVRVWNVESGKLVRELGGDPWWSTRALALTPDGQYLFVQQGYGAIHVFGVSKGEMAEKVEFNSRKSATGIALSSDGRRLALSVSDNIVVWDLGR